MSFMHSLVASAYHPLKLGNNLLRCLGAKSDARIRILIYHDISPRELDRFAAQLHWLSKSWTFISPQQFESMMRGHTPMSGANLLLSFDDGFASQRKIVEEVLNPMGIKALFFVVSDFVNISAGADCRAFIAQNICPGLPIEAIPDHWRNMSWLDLEWLLEAGHTIGAHTKTHARLSETKEANRLVTEIIKSADILASNLGVKIEHFAYPFGNLSSISPAALAVAMQRFSFIYTGLRGDNALGARSWSLRRDSLAPLNSLGLIGSLLEGCADFRYGRDLEQYASWVHLDGKSHPLASADI